MLHWAQSYPQSTYLQPTSSVPCFPLELPSSLFSLSPEKLSSLLLSPPKSVPGLWNNPQAAIWGSPENQALQCQGLNTHILDKAEV